MPRLEFELQQGDRFFFGERHVPYVMFRVRPTNDPAKAWAHDNGVLTMPTHEQMLAEYPKWATRETRLRAAKAIESTTEAEYLVR